MTDTARSLLEKGLAHHRVGRLADAAAAYEQALLLVPDDADAHHLRGVVALQTGDADRAETHLSRAVSLKPDNPDYQMNHATSLKELGLLEKALAAYETALAIRPDHADTLYNIGNTLLLAGRPHDARVRLEAALGHAPDNPVIRQSLGLALIKSGDITRGIDELRHVTASAPGASEAARNLAIALCRKGDIDEANKICRTLLDRQPDDPDVLNLAGFIALSGGQTQTAGEFYGHALERVSDSVEALIGLGNVARLEQRPEEAARLFERAITADPKSAEAHLDLGNVVLAGGEIDRAFNHFRTALDIDPDYSNAWANLGRAQKAIGDADAADASLSRAIEIEPLHPDARLARATGRLVRGRFAEGWRDYLHRDGFAATRDLYHREHLPGDLQGRRVLIDRDQGLGDELFFLRFADLLRARGAIAFYRAEPRLAEMLLRAEIVDRIVDEDNAPADVDLHILLGDLPYLLGMGDDDPVPPPFAIPAMPEKTTETGIQLRAAGPRPWIAVTWRAGTMGGERQMFKSAPMEEIARVIAPAVERTGGTVIAVQRDPLEGEVARFQQSLGHPVTDMTGLNPDLEAMLALMGQMDLYVCVSNTNVHLRAARGGASHVLVPNPPEFRWMASDDSSPWFPISKVYRQSTSGDWDDAFTALESSLDTLSESGPLPG